LPLNVPANSPLIYCNNTELKQAVIRIDNSHTYECNDKKVEITCPQKTEGRSSLDCDTDQVDENIRCKEQTLLNRHHLLCNSTSFFGDKIILNCYEGQIHKSRASSIPTDTTTERPTQSFGTEMHIFLMKLIGRHKNLEPANPWVAKALVIPPPPSTSEESFSDMLTRRREENKMWMKIGHSD
jgi:hypothetical protein